MKKLIVYPLVVIVIAGICTLLIKAFRLDFEGLFCDYTFESVLLIMVLTAIALLVNCDIYLSQIKQKKTAILKLEAERDSYKENLEKMRNVDADTRRLRAIIEHKQDSSFPTSD